MKLSLVISLYNQTDVLRKVLAGIGRQERWPDEILFADDGSAEATRRIIEAFSAGSKAPVRHVWHEDNGFRKTIILNKAVATARGDYLVFTDGDCVPHPNFVTDHFALAEKGFWVQGRRCFVEQQFVQQFQPGQTSVWFWMLNGRITGAPKGIRWPLPVIQRDTRQRGIIGCNMAFWRDDLIAVNGFDEAYAGWGVGEDSDIGTRLYHLGRQRKFVYGRAITFHLNHPQSCRDHHAASLARLNEVIRTRAVRCQVGLTQHLTSAW